MYSWLHFQRQHLLDNLSYDVVRGAVMAEEEAIMMLRYMFDWYVSVERKHSCGIQHKICS